MKKKPFELHFISQINRDGSGTTPVPEDYIKAMHENSLMKDEEFDVYGLSLSEKTFIANGFNSFVVKLKEFESEEVYKQNDKTRVVEKLKSLTNIEKEKMNIAITERNFTAYEHHFESYWMFKNQLQTLTT